MSQSEASTSPTPPVKKTRRLTSAEMEAEKAATELANDFVTTFVVEQQGGRLSHKKLKACVKEVIGLELDSGKLTRFLHSKCKSNRTPSRDDRIFLEVGLKDKLTPAEQKSEPSGRLCEAARARELTLTSTKPFKAYVGESPPTTHKEDGRKGWGTEAVVRWPDVTEKGWQTVEDRRVWVFVVENGCTEVKRCFLENGILTFTFLRKKASVQQAPGIYGFEYPIPPGVVVNGDILVEALGGFVKVLVPSAAPPPQVQAHVSGVSWESVLFGEDGEDDGEDDVEDDGGVTAEGVTATAAGTDATGPEVSNVDGAQPHFTQDEPGSPA